MNDPNHDDGSGVDGHEVFGLIEEWLRLRFGLTFTGARSLVLHNRLQQRLEALGVSSFEYFISLRAGASPEELELLIDLVTNGETYFFREEDQIVAFARNVAEECSGGKVSILSAGCSTGEEAYTLAFRLSEHVPDMGRVSIDAIDLDAVRLRQAGSAVYGERSLRAATDEQRIRYFVRQEPGLYRVREAYRGSVRFLRLNLVEPGLLQPARRYDAIFCRNVLIYFSEQALDQALERLVSWLRPGGLLFLGHSESVVGRTTALRTERMEEFIVYRRAGDAPRIARAPLAKLANG
jgi:chemotaxis protein methyltransferase CheR